MIHSLSRQVITLASLLVLMGCSVMTEDSGGGETMFLLETDDEVGARQLMKAARVVGEYRRLSAEEVKVIRERLSGIFNQMVEAEWREMKREAVLKRRPVPRLSVAKRRVVRKLRGAVALPILVNETRSVVAFGELRGAVIEVTPTAYQLDQKVDQLTMGAEILGPDGTGARLVLEEPAVERGGN
jgi:hypothetical protein